jgi:hypothetical protein
MSEDLTKKLPISDRDTILTAIKSFETYVRSSFDSLVTWVSSIDSRLKRLEQRVEERLYDTRPIWHKVVADVAQLQTGQNGLRSEVHELSNKVDNIGRDQIVFNDAIRKINLEFHTIDERLHRLEMNRN